MGLKERLYEVAGPRAQAALDRFRYERGFLPRVDTSGDAACTSWPGGARAALVVSADLELAWAWRYARVFSDPYEAALRLGRQTRANIEPLLALLGAADRPVTWATVGHLFLERCENGPQGPHPEIPRLQGFENDLWSFSGGDWFEHDPCSDLTSNPEWYAPDLVERIRAVDERHEIACHTFSHVDFADETCPPRVAEAELRATVDAAAERGIAIETMVFPGNRQGNIDALHACGFTAYRLHGRHHLGPVRRDRFGMLQIPGGLCLETPPGWAARDWAATLCRSIDLAIETGTLMHLWFHPSCDPVNLTEVFPVVLGYARQREGDLWGTTMKGVVEHCRRAR
jgi:hypothetical protein